MVKKKRTIQAEPIQADCTMQKKARAVRRPGASLLKVGLLFAAFMLAFHSMLWFAALQGREPLCGTTALIVSRMLALSGISNTIADGTHILMQNAHWVITPECSAVTVYILFVSFVLAYKSSLKSKVLAFAAGIPFICIMNFSRLFLLGVVTYWYPKYARVLHDYLWQVVFLVLVVAMWLVWIELVVNRETLNSVPE